MQKLVKTESFAVEERLYPVRYFESSTPRGLRRYSADILLGPGDHIILDGDSMENVEARATRLVPATLYSRVLARATAGLPNPHFSDGGGPRLAPQRARARRGRRTQRVCVLSGF